MTPLNDGLRDIEAIKQILKDKHVERTEVFIGDEPIPYRITEVVNMSVDVLRELLDPVIRHAPKKNLHLLNQTLAPNISETIAYTKADYSEYDVVESLTMDKEFLFDTLDDLVAAKTKEERIADLKEDIILYITKETKKDS